LSRGSSRTSAENLPRENALSFWVSVELLGRRDNRAMPDESTTPDLEEVGRRGREALNRGDLDAAVAMYARDAVWDVSLLGLEGVFEGHQAIRGALEDLIGPYEDLEVVAEEFRDLGGGVTLGVFVLRGRLRGSTRFVESRMASVSTWAHGLIERNTTYLDIDEALAAAERLAEERGG